MDLLIRQACVEEHGRALIVDIAVGGGRVVALAEPGDLSPVPGATVLHAGGCLVVPGLVETHIHLDKACILRRCQVDDGTLAEAVRETTRAKRDFTAEDIYRRSETALRQCIAHGTMRMRTHVEVDPGIGLVGFEAIQQLAHDYRWAVDIELCVFPQEGLLNNPGTEELLVEGLRRGARVIGAAPYVDSDPRGQIDRVFALARDFDVDIDMHLDLADTTDGMQAAYVCRKTEEYGWGGRVAIGHATQLSLLPPDQFADIAGVLAGAGVAVSILPSTDLYLMGRTHSHAVPRGVTPPGPLRRAGVLCSVSTNNVLNPFTPYGDGSLIRMANLCANVCQVARPEALAECLDMVTHGAARLMRVPDYGIAVGGPADLVALDATDAAGAVAALAQPLWGVKRGRPSFTRARPVLHQPRRGA
jgi:cytosine deaminase